MLRGWFFITQGCNILHNCVYNGGCLASQISIWMKVIVVLQDAHGTFFNGLMHHVYCNCNHFRRLYGKMCTMWGVLLCLFGLFQYFSEKTFLLTSLPHHYSPSSNCYSMNTHCISFYLINLADVMISIYFYPLQIHQNENCDQHLHL